MKNIIVFNQNIKNLNNCPFEAGKDLLSLLGITFKHIQTEGESFHKRYENNFFKKIQQLLEQYHNKNIMCLENNAYISLKETIKKIKLKANLFFINEVLEKYLQKSQIQYSFEDFNISFYARDHKEDFSDMSILKFLNAKVLKLSNTHQSNGFACLEANEELALNLAGDILFEAKDKGCDILIVNDIRDFHIFDTLQKKIEKVKKRPLDLTILSTAQVFLIALGKLDKHENKTNTHKIKPSFI